MDRILSRINSRNAEASLCEQIDDGDIFNFAVADQSADVVSLIAVDDKLCCAE